MLYRSRYFLLLTLLSVFLQGCPFDDFVIVAPEKEEFFVDTIPLHYEFTYAESPPESIALNGIGVLDYFVMEDGVGVAPGADLEAFLKQGINTLTIEPNMLGPRVDFFVDTEGPSIIITKVTGNGTKTITGTVQDPSGVSFLSINSVNATITEDIVFSVSVPSSDTYNFVSEDTDGRQSTGSYNTRDTVLENGLKVRIAQSALDEALPVTQEIIEDLDFNDLLADADGTSMTLFRETLGVNLPQVVLVPEVCTPAVCTPKVCSFGICTPQVCTPEVCTPAVTAGPINFNVVELEASLADVDIEEIMVAQLDIASGTKPITGNWEGLSLDAELINTDLAIRIDSYVLGVTDVVSTILDFLGLNDELDALDGNFTAGVHADRLRIAADLGLTAANGNVDVTIADINAVGLNDFNSDFDTTINLPDAFNLFGFGLADQALGLLTDGFAGARDFMLEVVMGNAVPIIADPIVDSIIEELRIGVQVGVTNNTLISALFQVRELDVVDNDSALLIGIDSLIGAEVGESGEVDIGFSVGSSPDILWVSDHVLPDGEDLAEALGPAPGIAPTPLGYLYNGPMNSAPDNAAGDVSVLSSATLVNQALLAFYESALLQIAVGYVDGLVSNEPNSDYTHRVIFQPATPPELVFKGSAPLVAYLRANNFQIKVQEKQAEDSWESINEVFIDAEIPVVIGVENNRLQLGLLTAELDIFSTNGTGAGFNLFSMENLLNRVLVGILIEQINLGLSELDIPGTFELQEDEASVTADIEGISVTSDKNLQININLNNG